VERIVASQERNEAGRLPGQDERQIVDIIGTPSSFTVLRASAGGAIRRPIVVNYIRVVPVSSYGA